MTDHRTAIRLPLAARGLEEAALLPDAEAAREVKRRLEGPRRTNLGLRGWLAWSWFLIPAGITTIILIDLYAMPALWSVLPTTVPWPLDTLLDVGLPLAIVAAIGIWLQRGVAARVIREVLRDRGIEVCLNCGYDLRRSQANQCPECGSPRPTTPSPNSSSI